MHRAFALLAFVTLAACSDESTKPSVEPIEGVYTLRTVDGAPLPYRTTASNVVVDLTSGRLSLSIPGSFTLDKWSTQQVGTQTPYAVLELLSGTWREEGNTLTLSTANPPTLITATYASGAITYSDNGRTYVWRRD